MKRAIEKFFLPPLPESQDEQKHSKEKWNSRRSALQSNSLIGGKFRNQSGPDSGAMPPLQDPLLSGEDIVDGTLRLQSDPSDLDMLDYKPRRNIHQQIQDKDSIMQMAYNSIIGLVHGPRVEKLSLRKPEPHSRSYTRKCISDARRNYDKIGEPHLSPVELTFFNSATSTSKQSWAPRLLETSATPTPSDPPFLVSDDTPLTPAGGVDEPDFKVGLLDMSGDESKTTLGWKFKSLSVDKTDLQADDPQDQTDLDTEAFKDAFTDAFSSWDNSERREMGQGFIGNLCGWDYKREEKVKNVYQHRPYFTYWVTFVQVIVFIVAVAVYGIGPIALEEVQIEDEMRTHNFAVERVTHNEMPNIWIGPRQADLIHLGAKYSPCMRADQNVKKAILADHEKERQTACCVRNDRSGCIQKSNSQCSDVLSTWHNWTKATGPDGRESGSVCGQDPRYCKNPQSQGEFTWEDDITTWPICKEGVSSQVEPYMRCEVVGRPCCIGIQGECLITTREYCEFRRGYFHPDASLCSQVSCMQEICGMIRFHNPQYPDQIYRLWISFFLHGGLFQLIFTVLFNFFIMRDMEKLAGWLRVFIIYFVSGIAGSLASAVFLPYHVEAGPSGSQFGILAMVLAELVHSWDKLVNPRTALLKLLGVILVAFVIGLLPYIDNYAHLFGLVFGFLMSFALMPHIDFNKFNRTGKIVGIVVCLLLVIGLFAVLVVLFYVVPIYHCPSCQYFNCVPITKNFCKNMEIKIGREYSVEL